MSGEMLVVSSLLLFPLPFALSRAHLNVSTKRSAWLLDCGWLGGAWTCVMQLDLQKWRNDSDVNCIPSTETNVSGRLCWLNGRLRMVMVEWVSAIFIGKLFGHLEWASTTIRKLRPLIGPAKSTSIRGHGCSEYVQCESTIRDGFFCASMQGTQLLTVF